MIICIACQKGGHNKTTAAVNLAAQWARNGRPGIVVDLDHHQLHSMKFAGSIPGVAFQNHLPTVVPDGAFVVIDTSPHVLNTTIAAMNLCDLVLVPSLASDIAIDAVDETLLSVSRVRLQKPQLGAMVFFTSVDGLKSSERVIRDFKARTLWPVSKVEIQERKHDFKQAYKKKQPVKATSPAGQDYLALAREIEDLF